MCVLSLYDTIQVTSSLTQVAFHCLESRLPCKHSIECLIHTYQLSYTPPPVSLKDTVVVLFFLFVFIPFSTGLPLSLASLANTRIPLEALHAPAHMESVRRSSPFSALPHVTGPASTGTVPTKAGQQHNRRISDSTSRLCHPFSADSSVPTIISRILYTGIHRETST